MAIQKKDAGRRTRTGKAEENKRIYRHFVEAIYGEDGPDVKSEAGSEIMTILDSLPFYVMLIDEDHNILFANKAVGQGLGVDPGKIIGEYCPTVVHGLEGPYPGCPLEESVEKDGIAIEREFFDDDSKRWYVSAVYPTGQLTREDKRVFFHTTRDITERKSAEGELNKSEERYRSLFNSSNDAVFVHRLPEEGPPGKFIEVNDTACRMLGYTRDELLELSPFDIEAGSVSPEDTERIIGKLFAEKHVIFERVMRSEDGRKIPVEISNQLFEFEGLPTVLSIVRDTSERRESESEILRLKDLNERIINGIADAISVINIADFKIAAVNKAFLDICGMNKAEVIGKTCHEITHHQKTPCMPPDDPCPIEDLLKTGKPTTEEHVHLDKDGHKTSVEVSAYPLYEEGEIKQIVHIAKDVTKQKKAEAELNRAYEDLKKAHEDLKSLDRMKSDIIANVTHELRTPITIAGGALELAKEEEDLESRNKLLKLARDSLMHQDFIVEDLVDATSIVGGKRKIKLSAVNLVDAISFLLGEFEQTAASRKIRIDVQLDEELPMVKVNYMQLNRVMRHLLDNAIKFNKDGGNVTIATAEVNGAVEVCVKDTGIGIPKNEQEKIFEHLYQIDSSSTRHYSGTGMGLAIVKEIIEGWGGKINVESAPEKGSTFCFTVPVVFKGYGVYR